MSGLEPETPKQLSGHLNLSATLTFRPRSALKLKGNIPMLILTIVFLITIGQRKIALLLGWSKSPLFLFINKNKMKSSFIYNYLMFIIHFLSTS